MIFNQIKYKWQNNNKEITENILSSMSGDIRDNIYTTFFLAAPEKREKNLVKTLSGTFHNLRKKNFVGVILEKSILTVWNLFDLKRLILDISIGKQISSTFFQKCCRLNK